MRKLRTPLQYESMLDELNEIRPLQVSDIVRQSICMPVCNRLAKSISKASDGVFVKGTQHGHILTKNVKELTQYQSEQRAIGAGQHNLIFDFSQPVYKVIIYVQVLIKVNRLYWGWVGSEFAIQDINSLGTHHINFVGDSICINTAIGVGGLINITVYGFY